ncbi:MAG: LPS export ABC transporter periplasmic protein LptC [Bacteroidaceae bacterium]|nr:LPS export ABC transporter periplasmic protein LptC [Bacteroidaceae bacterium]
MKRIKCRAPGLHFILLFFTFHCSLFILSCDNSHEHVAPAINPNDSLPFMTAHGISNLISDSGVISYKIVAEDWNIYTTQPQKWTFLKGLFLEKFDSTFHVEWHIQSDTAYCHDNRTWELRGRVVVLNREGTLFKSEELFWDMDRHEIWSNLFMRITKPDSEQQLEGNRFRSNEEMTDYHISFAAGYTPVNEEKEEPAPAINSSNSAADTIQTTQRASAADNRRRATQQ